MVKLSSTVITDTPSLVGLRGSWERLVARSADDELNMNPEWLLSWWKVFEGEDGRRRPRRAPTRLG